MIKATVKGPDGKHLLIIGLSLENLVRLQENKPIYFSTSVLDIKEDETVGSVTIFFGKTESDCYNEIERCVGPETIIKQAVKAPRRVQ